MQCVLIICWRADLNFNSPVALMRWMKTTCWGSDNGNKLQSLKHVLLSSDNCPSAITAMCSSSTFFLFALAISVLRSSSRFFFFLPRPSVLYDLLPDFFPLCLSHQCSTIFLQIVFLSASTISALWGLSSSSSKRKFLPPQSSILYEICLNLLA